VKTAHFAIADLAHGNNGAEWDAAFAERLVALSSTHAEKSSGTNATTRIQTIKVHFDTHCLATILPDSKSLPDIAHRMAAMIQAPCLAKRRRSAACTAASVIFPAAAKLHARISRRIVAALRNLRFDEGNDVVVEAGVLLISNSPRSVIFILAPR
jgi:hypothetical protein